MDGYLIDTNTLSASLDPHHTKHARAQETLATLEDGAPRYVSAIALAEVQFGHALAAGAGKPTVLELPNGLARGVRTASDFLMALQLTGAAKQDSIANLQLRLPSIVIGGGLTAIDTATEAMAYYPVQVEKFLKRYEILVAEHGAEGVRARFSAIELEVADEFIEIGRAHV